MKKALITIFVGVATAILIFIIKRALTPTPLPPVSIVMVDGQVLDRAGERVLENVTIHLHLLSVDETQPTDSLGRFKFSIKGFKPTDVGSIAATASGYKPQTFNLALQDMAGLHSIVLEAVPSPTPDLHPTVVFHPAAAQYVPRSDAKIVSMARRPN